MTQENFEASKELLAKESSSHQMSDNNRMLEKIWAKYSIDPQQFHRVEKFSNTFDQVLNSIHSHANMATENGYGISTENAQPTPKDAYFKEPNTDTKYFQGDFKVGE